MMRATPAVRVLLIEPHADTRELYVRWLTALGWGVIAAADGTSAKSAFVAHQPTLVVSETWLPEGHEHELLSAFVDAGVPVIALTTASPCPHSAFSGLPLSALLTKPCVPDDLVRVIQRVITSD
jgi:DNA-binding NtrC family response regulator